MRWPIRAATRVRHTGDDAIGASYRSDAPWGGDHMGIDVAATLLRAATSLDAAASAASSAMDLPPPRLFRRGAAIHKVTESFDSAASHAGRAARELETLGDPLADARSGVEQLRERIDSTIVPDLVHQRRYSMVSHVPLSLQTRAASLRLHANLIDADPAAARAALGREVDELVQRPYSTITHDDVQHLAAITQLPDELRPALPSPLRIRYGMADMVPRRMLPGSDNIARGEFDRLRLDALRRRLVDSGSVTRESLDAEVRAIIATSNADVTPAQVERLSLITGLPDELRPALVDTPVPWPAHRLEDLSAWGWTPARDGDARAKFDALRMATEHEQMIADPAVTRQSVTDELVALLAKPDSELSDADLYRTSLLARLPEQLRPSMPAAIDKHYRFEDLGLLRYHPYDNRAAATAFDQARVHMAAVVDPEGTLHAMRARLAAGQSIDIRVVTALQLEPELLGKHGITKQVLEQQAIRALSNAGTDGLAQQQQLSYHLRIERDRIAAMNLAPKLESIRSTALELAERNLARMSGARTDTYGRHPDYAEIGRFVSASELLGKLVPRAADDAASAAAATVADAADTIVW